MSAPRGPFATLASFVHSLAAAVLVAGSFAADAAAQSTITSAGSGSWSNSGTWSSGRVPGTGDHVRIAAGHEILYDTGSQAQIRSIVVNGVLTFATDRNTLLDVGLIAITRNAGFDVDSSPCDAHAQGAGPRPALDVGTWNNPVAAGVTATIRLRHHAGTDETCAPGIISHGGRMQFHGARFGNAWVKLGATAAAGASSLVAAEPVAWNVGDRVVIPATSHEPVGRSPSATITNGGIVRHTEEGTIVAISPDGRTVTIDRALTYSHRGSPDPAERRGELVNLSRNVIIESATPGGVRGHTMFHRNSQGSIGYAEFRHLGKSGQLGRYPIHFHKVLDTMRGSFVDGASIWDSDNRWIAVHNTEFMVIRNTVGYLSNGHGFFLEDGSEAYNVFDNVIGVNALVTDKVPNQVLEYDPNDGACYWAANARNFVYNSTFVECDNDASFILDYDPAGDMMVETRMPDGSRRTVAVNRMSGGKIENLEVHSTYGWGPWLRGGEFPDDEPMLFENTRVWNNHYSIDISGDNVIFDGVEIIDTPYGFYNLFPGPHLVRNAYCEDMPTHGCFMTYRGGHGTMLYENITTNDAYLVFRMNAKNEVGANGRPIDIHARNVTVLDPERDNHYIGAEGDNVRADPRLMLVLHDIFAPGVDAVVLPEKQSSTQDGVPPGLAFQDGGSTFANGVGFEGRGEMKVAQADVPWPSDHHLYSPVDRLPPATTITHPGPGQAVTSSNGELVVRGVSLDQGRVTSVTVNGVAASIQSNGFDWSATLRGLAAGELTLLAQAEDAAGNVEQYVHGVTVPVECVGAGCGSGQPPPAPMNLTVR